MPGVPTSKACDACRKQKKKVRKISPWTGHEGIRLGIQCVGVGQQRFKFKTQTFSDQKSRNVPSKTVVLVTPENKFSKITSNLISMLQINDTRFDLRIYGNFLDQIPQRLGINKALDSAVVAFTTAMPFVYTHKYTASIYSSYAQALKSTRLSLSNPAEAQSPETLCAIYLLMVCQGWIGKPNDVFPRHGEILSHLLSKVAVQNWQLAFEKDLITTLAFVTVLESFSNPNIELDHRIFALSEVAGPRVLAEDGSHIDSLHIRNLARMSKLIRHPDDDLVETRSIYRQLQSERIKMSALLLKASKLSPSDAARNIQVRIQMGYALLLAVALLFNAVLRNFDSTSDLRLAEESSLLVDDAVSTAEQANQYRPLGSSSIPLCLVVAWAVSDHDELRSLAVESILAEYQLDSDVTRWLESAQLLRAQLRDPLAGSIDPKPRGVLGFSGSQIGLAKILLAEEEGIV